MDLAILICILHNRHRDEVLHRRYLVFFTPLYRRTALICKRTSTHSASALCTINLVATAWSGGGASRGNNFGESIGQYGLLHQTSVSRMGIRRIQSLLEWLNWETYRGALGWPFHLLSVVAPLFLKEEGRSFNER